MCRYLNLIEYWANVINDTNNFSEECRRLAFSVLLCYPLKPAMVGHHQITCTHQNKVLLEKICSINRIFFSKCVSKQPFNKITVWDDNAEFMSSLRSQGTCITECKLVAIRKLPTSFTPVFSASGAGDEENIYRPLKSPKKIRMLLVTLLFSLPVLLVLVEVLFAAVLRTITYCSIFAQYWQCFYLMIWQ